MKEAQYKASDMLSLGGPCNYIKGTYHWKSDETEAEFRSRTAEYQTKEMDRSFRREEGRRMITGTIKDLWKNMYHSKEASKFNTQWEDDSE
jgi:hypothetical protein